jgi:hypothetical protein
VVDSTADGRIRIFSVVSIANIAAPTAAELTAGVDLTNFIPPGGLTGFQAETEGVDNTKINSVFNTQLPGRVSLGGPRIRFIKQVGSDAIWTLFTYGFVTNIVIRQDYTYATAWTAAQQCRVYPITAGEFSEVDTAPNEMHSWEIQVFPSTAFNQRAVVA